MLLSAPGLLGAYYSEEEMDDIQRYLEQGGGGLLFTYIPDVAHRLFSIMGIDNDLLGHNIEVAEESSITAPEHWIFSGTVSSFLQVGALGVAQGFHAPVVYGTQSGTRSLMGDENSCQLIVRESVLWRSAWYTCPFDILNEDQEPLRVLHRTLQWLAPLQ